MKKLHLLLLFSFAFLFSQNKPVQRLDDNVTVPQYAQPKVPDDTKLYSPAGLDVIPEYPGGTAALQKYFSENINMTALKEASKKKHKVVIAFTIEADGTVSAKQVLGSPAGNVGKEVNRVLDTLTQKWSPGLVNGKSVRVLYHFPVIINLL